MLSKVGCGYLEVVELVDSGPVSTLACTNANLYASGSQESEGYKQLHVGVEQVVGNDTSGERPVWSEDTAIVVEEVIGDDTPPSGQCDQSKLLRLHREVSCEVKAGEKTGLVEEVSCGNDGSVHSSNPAKNGQGLVHNSEASKNCQGYQSKLLRLHEVVKKSGKANIRGCRIPLESRWKCDYLERELENYEDKEVAQLCEFGWPININDDEFKVRGPPRNWRSSTDHASQMDQYIERELREGTLLGPFETNPFSSQAIVSPLSTTEKRDSEERRVIMDLSFPPGDSVNDKIPRDEYLGEDITLKYPGVDALVALIKKKGQGCALMKVDLRRAYKQIHTDPGDWNFLGLRWRGRLMFDRTMPMGLRSAAMCCQRITNAFKYMVEKKGFDLVAYLDDMVSAETWSAADKCLDTIRSVVSDSGAEEAEAKTVFPTCVMLFLGILFNTLTLTLEIAQDRLTETEELLDAWLRKTHMTRKEVESLVGKLSFIASCVRPGRLFISRLLECLRGMPQVGKFKVTEEVRKDLLWWREFLPLYNGVSMMALESWSLPDEVFASDACLIGCGGWYCERQEYFHTEFPGFIVEMNLSINALELLTVVVAAKVWGKHWKGKRIVVHCDNEVSVTVMNTGRSHNAFLQSCLRELEFTAAKCEFEIRGNHIPGIENRIPDALSRWHEGELHREKFWVQVEGLRVQEMFVYEGLFAFLHEW